MELSTCKKVAAFGVALAALPAFAQTTAPASSAAASSTSENEVMTLQAFNVTGDAAHGYVASESVTGTRIASKLQDLPFAVNVVTSEFMSDFAAFNIADQMALVPTFSPSEVFGQYQIRGFPVSSILVDGLRRVGGNPDTSDLDRIEIIKGSAASIYGAIQPGGAVNYLTKQPTTTPTDEIYVAGGSDNFARMDFNTSGPIGSSGKLFYRIDYSDQRNKYSEEFSSTRTTFLAGKLLYKPNDNTSITFNAEYDDIFTHPFDQVLTVTEKVTMPWAGNSITESQYFGMETNGLLNYSYAGPESYYHYRVKSATLRLEHAFSDFWQLKFGANAYLAPENDQLVGSGAYYPYGTGNVTSANGVVTSTFTPEVKDQPQADWDPVRGTSAQLDNLFSFDAGPVKNKLLLTADFAETTQRSVTLVPTVTGSQATDYYALYSPYSPAGASYYTMQTTWDAALGYGWNTTLYNQNPSLYNGVTTDNWTAASDYGLFASERASLWNDRWIVMLGGRYDDVKNQVANYNINANGSPGSLVAEPAPSQAFEYSTSARTYQIGTSFKINDELNIYANKSSAFNPQPQIDSFTGLALPNNKSDGYEYGIKGSFLNNRLNLTLDQFLINEHNLLQSENDPVSGQKESDLIKWVQAKGEEFSGTYQVNNSLLLMGSWGMMTTDTKESDELTFLDGLPFRRVPRNTVAGGLRYQFSNGPLKGVWVLAIGRYTSKSLVNLGSGKSLVPGPASTTVGGTVTMYYVSSLNETYVGTDPKATGETKITATPVINAPFPGNGQLPYPGIAANALINYPVGSNGQALPQVSTNIYQGAPTGVYVDDGRELNFNAPYATFDLGVGYTLSLHGHPNKIQVNLKNLTNRKYTYGSGVPGAPFQVIASYDWQY